MTWPAVFDGIGALFVSANNDPDVQAQRIPGLTWVALKVNGADASPLAEQEHWVGRMRARGIQVGSWVYCFGPPANDSGDAISEWQTGPSFAVYDVEAEYKTDGGAPADWPAQLVHTHPHDVPAAVTSYGAIPGYGNQPSSIDFHAFASAGWPIIAQAYDGFTVPDSITYATISPQKFPGPYPGSGVHTMVRALKLVPGQAVYRPESIDG